MAGRRAAENNRHGALRTLPSRGRSAYTDGTFPTHRKPPKPSRSVPRTLPKPFPKGFPNPVESLPQFSESPLKPSGSPPEALPDALPDALPERRRR